MSNTQTFSTHLGDISAETCECENCGNEVLTKDAVTVAYGLYEKSCHGVTICDATHDSYRQTTQLCEYCAEETLGIRQKGKFIATASPFVTAFIGALFGLVLGAAGITWPAFGILVLTIAIAAVLTAVGTMLF